MTNSTIKRLFPNKKYCIVRKFGKYTEYWVGGCIWFVDDKSHVKLGTKRELEIILNKKLYQSKIRGAKVVEFK